MTCHRVWHKWNTANCKLKALSCSPSCLQYMKFTSSLELRSMYKIASFLVRDVMMETKPWFNSVYSGGQPAGNLWIYSIGLRKKRWPSGTAPEKDRRPLKGVCLYLPWGNDLSGKEWGTETREAWHGESLWVSKDKSDVLHQSCLRESWAPRVFLHQRSLVRPLLSKSRPLVQKTIPSWGVFLQRVKSIACVANIKEAELFKLNSTAICTKGEEAVILCWTHHPSAGIVTVGECRGRMRPCVLHSMWPTEW